MQSKMIDLLDSDRNKNLYKDNLNINVNPTYSEKEEVVYS